MLKSEADKLPMLDLEVPEDIDEENNGIASEDDLDIRPGSSPNDNQLSKFLESALKGGSGEPPKKKLKTNANSTDEALPLGLARDLGRFLSG